MFSCGEFGGTRASARPSGERGRLRVLLFLMFLDLFKFYLYLKGLLLIKSSINM